MFLYHYIDEEWHRFRRKTYRKKEMGFYVADIKTVNQQVSMPQYIKTMENTPKTQYLYL